ncbi:MAG: phosphotransferase [Kineosporiaceae bacterium]
MTSAGGGRGPGLELLATGRSANVYRVDESTVLRRYRDGTDVTAEADLMRHLGGAGFPVPAVFGARGTELLMERLTGPTLLERLVAGRMDGRHAVDLLVDLHHRLHSVPLPAGLPGADPGDAILHLDLHPANIIMSERGPVVIDWRDAAPGPADLDQAMSALVMASVALDPANPWAALAQAFLQGFCARIGEVPPALLDAAAARRLQDPGISPDDAAEILPALDLVRELWPAVP